VADRIQLHEVLNFSSSHSEIVKAELCQSDQCSHKTLFHCTCFYY